MIQEGIQRLIEKANLSYEEACSMMTEVISGQSTNAQPLRFLPPCV